MFVKSLAEKYASREIKLIPMHYFYIGGDDRLFLNSILLELEKDNITVQNKNLTLEETMKTYKTAYFNVGMRFHAVVLQTLLSGKNFILDYTEPKRGKISAFINDIDNKNFYADRYVSLQDGQISIDIVNNVNNRFLYDMNLLKNKLRIYIETLQEHVK